MIKFETVTDKEECKKLWETYSTNQILWDLWDIRFCFHNENFSFNFMVGYKSKAQVGILPLVFEKREKIYTYFGDTFPEQNKFLLNGKNDLAHFLDKSPEGTEIYHICPEESNYYKLKSGDKRFFLNLEKHGYNFENYLKSFNKKHRKNLNYDLKKLYDGGLEVWHNSTGDFERLVELNRIRFGKESDYDDKYFVSSMSELVNFALKLNILDMVSILINKKTEAVGLGIFYNHRYYILGTGRNVGIKNLGKLLIKEHIKSAISHKCREIDFLSTEASVKANWKELWNLESEQMYEFEK